MALRFLRLDFSGEVRDFEPVVMEPGLPLLDKSSANFRTLYKWLGRLIAEPEWHGNSVGLYVCDEEGRRLRDARCEPATAADLRRNRELAAELNELRSRIEQIKPEPREFRLYEQVLRCFRELTSESTPLERECHFFKYREAGCWRLVWALGYQRSDRASASPTICTNPDCSLLYLRHAERSRTCPSCHAASAMMLSPRLWLSGSAAAMIAAAWVIGGTVGATWAIGGTVGAGWVIGGAVGAAGAIAVTIAAPGAAAVTAAAAAAIPAVVAAMAQDGVTVVKATTGRLTRTCRSLVRGTPRAPRETGSDRTREGADRQHLPYVDENVQFTVFRPKVIPPEAWCDLVASAHLEEKWPNTPADEPEPLEKARAKAQAVLKDLAPKDIRESTQDSSQAVPQGGQITFVPQIEGVRFNPLHHSFLWEEDEHTVVFRMWASAALDGRIARGRMTVFLGVVIVADIPLKIQVTRSTQRRQRKPKEVRARRYRKIFASYSHCDLAIVEQFERYAEAIGDKYLRDWKNLRPGDRWDEKILKMIDRADIFQLFWSRNAMQSEFVRREWEHALKRNQEGFIRPVYWEEPYHPPKLLPAPPALAELHFQRMGGGFGCHVPSPAAVDASTSTAATGDSAPENPDPARPQQHPDSLATGSGGTIQGPGGKELTVQPKPDIDRTITLSFRTLGAPGAGKTRWLAETYLGLRSGLALEGSQIESMPTPASDEFRQLIEQMHEEKQRVAAAQHEGIPSPLIFHFRGRHHWRKSDILFDMSDYSGDMAERRQATDADGYLFFLDLTRPISELIDVLYDFREDVMGVCGLKPGRELRTPVALCFSKIDLLVNLPSACGAVEGFYHELAAIGWGLDLRSIERRSELARELRKVIWPDWEVERQIRALFGARFLYFPLTTVGLNELGITDLKRRTIEPCGLLHPMLWLLEMNGYHVFQRKSMFDWIGRLAPWRT